MSEGFKNIYSYTNLILKKGVSFATPKVVAHIPNPSENDYKAGYIERVFILKKDDKHVSTVKCLPSETKSKAKTIKIYD